MGFGFFSKKKENAEEPIENHRPLEGNAKVSAAQNNNETAAGSSEERKEKAAKFIFKITELMQRVDLLEKKVDRLERKTGVKNEENQQI